jgi:hypothetical protein
MDGRSSDPRQDAAWEQRGPQSQWLVEGCRVIRGVLSFGFFSLHEQRKESRLRCENRTSKYLTLDDHAIGALKQDNPQCSLRALTTQIRDQRPDRPLIAFDIFGQPKLHQRPMQVLAAPFGAEVHIALEMIGEEP